MTRGVRVKRPSPGPRVSADPLWRLKLRDVKNFLVKQPVSFLFLCFYLFIEYVRPQQVWPQLDVLPWGQASIYGTAIALVLEGKFPQLRTPLAKAYLLFIVVVLASGVTAVYPSETWAKISLPLSWFLVFLLITNIVTNERRFLIFMGFFLLWSFKMSQHGFRSWLDAGFGFRSWGATGGPGWFHNSGEFGIQMCVFFPLSVAFILGLRKYWDLPRKVFFWAMPITAVASMIASSSRGALVGGGAVLIWMIARSRFRLRAAVYGAVLVAAVIVVVPEEQKERFRTAGDDETSVARTTLWADGREIAAEFPVLGIGYNNWLRYYRIEYGGTQVSHNIFIEAWAEMGYIGLGMFVVLILGTFGVNWGTRRLVRHLGERGRFIHHMAHGLDGALIGYLVSGFFVTVLHYPYFWINLSMTVALRVVARRLTREAADAGAGRAAPRPRARRRMNGERQVAAMVAGPRG